MATIRLGNKPHGLSVNLTTGADFVAILRTKADEDGDRPDWPDDSEARLVIDGDTVWDATRDGSGLVFNVPSEEADLVPNNASALLFYKQGPYDAVWAKGTVTRL